MIKELDTVVLTESLPEHGLERGDLVEQVLRVSGNADVTEKSSQAKFAVRTETDKLKACVVRLAVEQNEVWPDVGVAVIALLAAERMIEIAPWQRLIPSPAPSRLPLARRRAACCAVPISPACSRV